MDVLCTDKTGTLTENQLALAAALPFNRNSEDDVLRSAALASDPATQDPIDLAILSAAEARGLLAEQPERLEFVPFDPRTTLFAQSLSGWFRQAIFRQGRAACNCSPC